MTTWEGEKTMGEDTNGTPAPDVQGVARDAGGRWLPGHTGNPNGRPRRFDLFELAKKRAKKTGHDLKDVTWHIFQSMLRQASEGDVQAGALLLKYLCEPADPSKALVAIDARSVTVGNGQAGDPMLLEGAPPGPVIRDSAYDRLYRQGKLAADHRYGPQPPSNPVELSRQLAELSTLVASYTGADVAPGTHEAVEDT